MHILNSDWELGANVPETLIFQPRRPANILGCVKKMIWLEAGLAGVQVEHLLWEYLSNLPQAAG
jgi:hypothetical protein